MKIENEDGDLLWAPNNFGSYSVDKVSEITEILSNLLKDLTIKVSSEGWDDISNYYNKQEVDAKLLDYVLKSDYSIIEISEEASEVIKNIVLSHLTEVTEDIEHVAEDVGVNAGNINNLKYAADFWTKCCLNMTYAELLAAETPPTATSFASRLNNLETIQESHVTYLQQIIQDMYKNQDTRNDLLLSTRAFTGEMEDEHGVKVIIGTGDKTYPTLLAAINDLLANSAPGTVTTLSGRVDNLDTRVTNLDTTVTNLNYVNKSSDVVTESSNTSDKVPAASLEYKDRQDINALNTKTGNLTDLSNKITDKSSLVAAINDLASQVDNLLTRVRALEGDTTPPESGLNLDDDGSGNGELLP